MLAAHDYRTLHKLGLLEKKRDYLAVCSEIVGFEPELLEVIVLPHEIGRGVR
jgi:hypothetical protein